jgi:hypothetical protein
MCVDGTRKQKLHYGISQAALDIKTPYPPNHLRAIEKKTTAPEENCTPKKIAPRRKSHCQKIKWYLKWYRQYARSRPLNPTRKPP